MNIAGIIVTFICIGIIALSIYMLVRNIKNQLKGNGCGNCHECSVRGCGRKK